MEQNFVEFVKERSFEEIRKNLASILDSPNFGQTSSNEQFCISRSIADDFEEIKTKNEQVNGKLIKIIEIYFKI